jgi:hypothetical protein
VGLGLAAMLAMVPLVLAQDDPEMVSFVLAQDGADMAEEGPSLLIVLEQIDLYGLDGTPIGVAEAGDLYLVLGMEGQWALAVTEREPDWPVWIDVDARVLVLAPVPIPSEAVDVSPPVAATAIPTQVPTAVEIPTLAVAPTPEATPTLVPEATATWTPTSRPSATPTVESPSAWALTTTDLPSGFTRAAANTIDRGTFLAHRVLFSRNISSTVQAPAFSETVALKEPLSGTIREFVDLLAETEARDIITSYGGGAVTSASGPSVGEVTRWMQAELPNRIDVHVVVFAVRNDFAIVGIGNLRGSSTQSEVARIANIVAGRMRR